MALFPNRKRRCSLVLGLFLFPSVLGLFAEEDVAVVSFSQVSVTLRRAYTDHAAHEVTARQFDFQGTIRGSLQPFKAEGTAFDVRAETGCGFDDSWMSSGTAWHDASSCFNVKDISVRQRLGSKLTVSAGGFDFDRGAGTEATSAANEGWLSGFRITAKPGGVWWSPDRVGIMAGYVGNFQTPNFFARLRHLSDFNYYQVAAEKDLEVMGKFSGEISAIQNVVFVRPAFTSKAIPSQWIHTIGAELIVRASAPITNGYAAQANWQIGPRADLTLRFSRLDPALFVKNSRQILLNGGEYGLGNRVGLVGNYRLIHNFDMTLLVSRAVYAPSGNRWRGFLALSYRFDDLANHVVRNVHKQKKGTS